MNKKTIKWLVFLLVILALPSITCDELVNDFKNRYVDLSSGYSFCDEKLYFEDGFVHCDYDKGPLYENNVSGKLYNLETGYAQNVNVIIYVEGEYFDPSCSVHFDVIGPRGYVPVLCQIKYDQCLPNNDIYLDRMSSCEYMSADEYIHQQTHKNEDTEGQDIIHGAEGDDEILGGEEMTIEDLMPTMQPVIDSIRGEWLNKVKEYPCKPEQAETAYQTWVGEQARSISDGAGGLVGEGYPWITMEEFSDWLIASAERDENEKVIKTWKGDFSITTKMLDRCFACVPPTMTGNITLTVDLKTCVVEGNVSAAGEGDTTVNDCIDGQPIAATCTAHGKMDFSGKITGNADKDGVLTLDQTIVSTNYSSAWVAGCDWASRDVETEQWDDPVDITGSIDWQGAASGTFKYASDVCSLEGDWSGNSE